MLRILRVDSYKQLLWFKTNICICKIHAYIAVSLLAIDCSEPGDLL